MKLSNERRAVDERRIVERMLVSKGETRRPAHNTEEDLYTRRLRWELALVALFAVLVCMGILFLNSLLPPGW